MRSASPLPRSDARGVQERRRGACSAPSAARSGRISRSSIVPSRACSACARHSACSPTCGPSTTIPELSAASPLKAERLQRRGHRGRARADRRHLFRQARPHRRRRAFDTCEYTVAGNRAGLSRRGATSPAERRGKITSVDKANVLDTSRLWRDVATRVFRDEFPEAQVEHLLVDAAAMHLLSRPADFDVMVTENMFGDILTDEASMLAGSMGLLPSASLGDGGPGLYEPIHGSAPDIAGQRSSPIPAARFLSSAMMLRYSLRCRSRRRGVETAVSECSEGRRRGRAISRGPGRRMARHGGLWQTP